MFKKGQIVLCIGSENPEWLTIGKEYEIAEFNGRGQPLVKCDGIDTCDMNYGSWLVGKKIFVSDPIEDRLVKIQDLAKRYKKTK